MAQECCTSCDSTLVTPYLFLSPDKNPPMTSCSFLFILLFAFGTSVSSQDPRRDLQKASPTPNRNAMIFAWKWVHAKGNGVRKPKSARAVPPILSQPAILGHCHTKGIFPFPLLTIRYLYMFTLRIKSSSGLGSVAHSLLLLFSEASQAAFPWLFSNSLDKEGSPWPEPTGTIQYSSWQTWEITQSKKGLGFSWTNTFSTLANIGLSCQAPAHPLSLHWDSLLYLPIRTQRGCRFLIPSFWIRPCILLTT